MRDSRKFGRHTYQLVLGDDGKGAARIIEFEAAGAESALTTAQRMCGGREVEVLQDGRSLGRVKNDSSAGFWILRGSRAEPAPQSTVLADPFSAGPPTAAA